MQQSTYKIRILCFIFAIIICQSAGLERTSNGNFADVERTVTFTGFHRILKYHVLIHNVTGPTKILIEETLPKDVYIDPHQLSKEINDGRIMIADSEMVNIETPAYQAKPINIKICSSSSNNTHKILFPIHMRYQKPHHCNTHGESITVKLNTPFLFFKDNTNNFTVKHCLGETNDYSWPQLETQELENSLTVPVGCIEHQFFVLYLTGTIITIGSLLYSLFILKSNL